MTASGVIAIGACATVLGWCVYHIVKGALAERERRYNEARLVMRVQQRSEREEREAREARQYWQAMADMNAWCREQAFKVDEEVRDLERLFEMPCAADPKWLA